MSAVVREFVVLEFGRDPPAFNEALLNSGLAQQMASLGVDVQPSWANGAKVFVHNLRPEMVQPLRSRHVVVYPEDQEDIIDALSVIPSRTRPRLKPRAQSLLRHSDDESPSLLRHSDDESLLHCSSIMQSAGEWEENCTTSEANESSGSDHECFVNVIVSRTFIEIRPECKSPRASKSF